MFARKPSGASRPGLGLGNMDLDEYADDGAEDEAWTIVHEVKPMAHVFESQPIVVP